MEFYLREYFLYRLLSGFTIIEYKGQKLKIGAPSYSMLYEAQYDTLSIDENIFSEEDMIPHMIRLGQWSEREENELNNIIPSNLEKLKIGLYESRLQSNKANTIRKYIKLTNDEFNRLYFKRQVYRSYTLDGLRQYCRNQYLISRIVTTLDDKLVDWNEIAIDDILSLYYKESLSITTVRELVRTSPWVNFWQTIKKTGTFFENKCLNLDQQSALSWSMMYDNIYESANCPSDDVINDDDMLDGWLLIQKRNRATERNQKDLEDKVSGNSKIANSDEIFVVVDTIEDAKKIQALNDPIASAIQKSRIAQIKQSGGSLKEQQLADIKQKRAIEANKAYIQNVRRG